MLESLSILYVIDGQEFGGGEQGFGQLSTGLNKEKFKVQVAAHSGGVLEERVLNQNIPFFPVDMSKRFSLSTVQEIAKIVSQNNVDIVHSMGARSDFLARVACRKLPKTAVINTIAMFIDGFDVGPLKKTVYLLADRWSAQFVDHYIAVSQAIGHRLTERCGIPEDKITVIYNGVDRNRYERQMGVADETRRSLGIQSGVPIIGAIGRLVYQKGYIYLLEAAALVLQKMPHVRFVLVGEGPEEASLKQKATSLGISDSCIFTGARYDVAELLSSFDVFILSSVLEGLPRTVIEAMAAGCPIVATDIEGVREEVEDGKSAMLVKPADPASLANAVTTLLNDRKLGERIGQEARKRAEQLFDLRKTIKNVEHVYEKVASRLPVE